ncbi:unnamed protein product [Symbiodinium microadriaticum]|nr:unnamed protein product [Symbiodinium microadriaticum]
MRNQKSENKKTSAKDLLGAMERDAVPPNEFSFSSAIKACEQIGRWVLALSLLDRMMDLKVRPNLLCLNSAISACGVGGRWSAALELLGVMDSFTIEKDVISFNSAVAACEVAAQWELAGWLLCQMQVLSLQPNTITYNSVISTAEKSGQWQVALGLLAFLPAQRIPLDLISLNSAILACRGRWEVALSLLYSMRILGLSPDVVSYHSAYVACDACGLWHFADELLLCMGLLGCSKGRSTDLAFRFDFPHFKRVAMVVVGEPPEAFKAKAHAVLLAEKQEKLDAEWKVRQADKDLVSQGFGFGQFAKGPGRGFLWRTCWPVEESGDGEGDQSQMEVHTAWLLEQDQKALLYRRRKGL